MMHDAFSLRGLAASCVLLFPVAPVVQAAERPPDVLSIDARAWILMDYASGKVLNEDNADEKLDPASLTKIMTSYVVGQAIKAGKIKLTDTMIIGHDAWATDNPTLRGSSVMFLKPGVQVLVEGLNKGVTTQSGNDANVAIADCVAGSQNAFASLMSGYARRTGLTSITFMIVHGLDTPGQFNTVRDMALLTRAMIHDMPEKYAIHKEKEFTFNKIRRPNRSRLLWNTNLNADGARTRTTAGAGYNPISSVTQGDMCLIAVVLRIKTDRIRLSEPEKLPTWGFRFHETVTPIKPDATFVIQRAWFGNSSEAKLGAGEAGSITLPKGQLRNLKASYTLNQPQPIAPLEKGQVIGAIGLKLNDKTIERRPLIVVGPVKEGGFFNRMIDFVLMRLHGWFGNWFS